uniref:Small ribosomal subunit protein uS3c n=1 Tax=Monsonia speciosa TaxID=163694 RepID=B7T3V4_9ROSI|nr:ribosomal protein S3 [Monsonia speciosa]ACH47270.1 ribosomal protein S3 [Monsonia speciosa]ADJ66426.1 ribosomal protein S3 [Monsonia speciosa]
MGQKINPLGFRLGTTQNHHSVWFEKPKNYCESLKEDKKIRDRIKNYIDNRRSGPMKDLITRIQIEKGMDLIKVIIYMGFQELFMGDKPAKTKKGKRKRGQKGKKEGEPRHIKELRVRELKVNVAKALHLNLSGNRGLKKLNVEKGLSQSGNRQLKVVIRNISNPYGDPNILAEFLADQLKNRISFRKAMKRVIELAKEANTKGVKVQIAGRLGGRDIARVECLLQGRVPLHTIRAKIDFCSTRVQMLYGVLGIKIWIFSDTEVCNE